MTEVAEILEVAVKHHQSGDLTGARQQYLLVLKSDPDNSTALHSLGIIAYQTGQYDSAFELISKAIEANPQVPQFHNTLGAVYKALGKFEEAIEAYKKAISLRPDFAEAYSNMGFVLQLLGWFEASAEKCRRAVKLNPSYAQAYNNLGLALQAQEQIAEAIENYTQALQIEPNYAQAYNNLGTALKSQGKFEDAIENYKHAIRLEPGFAETYNNLGRVLSAQGQIDKAIENYRCALKLKPDYAGAHWNLSYALLLRGRLIEGWEEFEWRREPSLKFVTYPDCHQSQIWDGSTFAGKRLFVRSEQGLGDSIQFIRYLPMVKALGGTVIFESPKPLFNILQDFDAIDELVQACPEVNSDVEYDFYVPLMSLPGIFATTLETIPADLPYLYADPIKMEYWKDKFTEADFKVGIVWAGSPGYDNDHNRSCALKHFTALAKIEGVKLYSLQKGNAAAQLDELPPNITIHNFAEQLDDFTDTAAVIENLDLVISVDTAVAHLAGAMGKPVFVLLPFVPEWRWLLNRDDSPWYPTMRLFRQEKWGDWDGVFARAAEQLRILTEKHNTETSLANQTG
ncbi:MAG: tetratricopeptide repeat protein [Planctomycetes bacterium]|nr:tetratricopeptide repeat protein [Planctomycetota bacterium]